MPCSNRARCALSILLCSFVGLAPTAGCTGGSGSTAVADASPGPQEEAGPEEAGPDATSCRPGDVDTYQPASYHSATASGQGDCVVAPGEPDPVQGFYDACLGPLAASDTCMAFETNPSTAACAHCIVTPDSDAHYGPLVDHGGFITANVAGCLELTNQSSLSCDKALQALDGCELAACEANCPVHDATSRAAYDACAAQADSAGCHLYQAATACIAAQPDSGDNASCMATSFVAFYNAVVPLFCGAPAATDAQVPAFDAAPASDGSSSFDAASADATATDASGSDAWVDAGSDAGPAAHDAAVRAQGDASSDGGMDGD